MSNRLAAGASAHHSSAAEFDKSKPANIDAAVTNIDWMNPHVRIFLKDEGGPLPRRQQEPVEGRTKAPKA